MKTIARSLHFLMVCASSQLWVGAELLRPAGAAGIAPAHQDAIRKAVERHRASQREERQREEAAAGRRLTSAELSQLRSQVRQQSMPGSGDQGGVVEARQASGRQAAEPSARTDPDAAAAAARSHTMPRSQRQQ